LIIWGHEYLLTARIDISDLNSRVLSNKPTQAIGGNGSGSGNNNRRKRAREAREALERSTTTTGTGSDIGTPTNDVNSNIDINNNSKSTSTSLLNLTGGNGDGDGEMVKIHGGESFRSIIGAGFFSFGEMLVVERPLSDYMGELPPAFVSASYGRS
jgi:hypothetical protein